MVSKRGEPAGLSRWDKPGGSLSGVLKLLLIKLCGKGGRLAWLSALLIGCSGAPAGIEPPQWDPAVATERALNEYDSSGDQKLSKEELKASPGLLSALGRFDQDGDGAMSADELRSNLEAFRQQDASLVAVSCVVNRGNQPLEGATVKFVPEDFMSDSIKPASGVTGRDGTAPLSIAEAELPEEYRGRVSGVHCGIYRVEVTHPRVNVPAKYNAQSELGRIVTRRDHETLTVSF
jgi:hypothetical protein